MHFNLKQLIILEANASIHVLNAVVFQLDPEGKMHLIAFYS